MHYVSHRCAKWPKRLRNSNNVILFSMETNLNVNTCHHYESEQTRDGMNDVFKIDGKLYDLETHRIDRCAQILGVDVEYVQIAVNINDQ